MYSSVQKRYRAGTSGALFAVNNRYVYNILEQRHSRQLLLKQTHMEFGKQFNTMDRPLADCSSLMIRKNILCA